MKEQTQNLARFSSSFKALLYALGLTSTDEVEEFLGSENPATLDQMFLTRLFKLDFRDGFFLDNLRHLCCSDNEPYSGHGAKLVAESYVGEEGFCYHTNLTSELSSLYLRLVEFCQNSLSIQSGFYL